MTAYTVNILDEELHDSVINSLIQDLDRFGVTNVKTASALDDIHQTASLDPDHACYLICSAEAAHSHLVADLRQRPIPTLRGILVFCGPHEDFYAKWAIQHTKIIFLTHNLRELRRAIVWIASGGSFGPNGDAIPAKRDLGPKRSAPAETCSLRAPGNKCTDIAEADRMVNDILAKQQQFETEFPMRSSSHRASTDTTASFNSSNVEPLDDKLAEIAQLVAFFEALRTAPSRQSELFQ